MSNPYIGEIRLFGGNFAPAGWAMCDGSLVPISENDALFNLIGTTYGGDGQETFGLPDLRGAVPIHMGTGPGLSTYVIGQSAGTESVTLTQNQLPNHSHPFIGSTSAANTNSPNNAVVSGATGNLYFPFAATAQMAAQSISPAGGSQPHENMMPYLCITFIISLYGVYPTQT